MFITPIEANGNICLCKLNVSSGNDAWSIRDIKLWSLMTLGRAPVILLFLIVQYLNLVHPRKMPFFRVWLALIILPIIAVNNFGFRILLRVVWIHWQWNIWSLIWDFSLESNSRTIKNCSNLGFKWQSWKKN